MKVLILYFSGTGNTKIITDNYIKSLNEKEIDAKSIPLESIDQCFSVDEYDKIGFAYPIHGFNAPKIVLDKAKLILKAKDIKNAFILMVS
ncbi:MAG: 4Fe-4S ferredoxin, partial [Gammaproteobacteria bacterium]|nr:4Fe-4S ferredoxin [Gammaproteobacteria bacterium]